MTKSHEHVTFDQRGKLDEVYASGGCHLERMDKNSFFMIFINEDGSQEAFWFTSKDLGGKHEHREARK